MCLLQNAATRRRRAAVIVACFPAMMVPIFLFVIRRNHANAASSTANASDFRLGLVVGILLAAALCSLIVATRRRNSDDSNNA